MEGNSKEANSKKEPKELDMLDPELLVALIDALKTNDHKKKKAFPTVFYTSGHWAGRVRPQYFEFALMSDLKSTRYVSDDVLDELIPEWREYMNGKAFPTSSKAHEAPFRAWCIREREQYAASGVPFPQPSKRRAAAADAAVVNPRIPQRSASGSATIGQQGQVMSAPPLNMVPMNAQVMEAPTRTNSASDIPAVNAPMKNPLARGLSPVNVRSMNAPVRSIPLVNSRRMMPMNARTKSHLPMNARFMNAPAGNVPLVNAPPMYVPGMTISAMNIPPPPPNTPAMNPPGMNTVAVAAQDLQNSAFRLEQLAMSTHQFADMLSQHGQRELRVAQLLLDASRARQEQPRKE